MSVEGTERDYVQSIERGFAVLLAFDADRPSPTLAELATATGLSRPAVRRILLTLQKLGYVAALVESRDQGVGDFVASTPAGSRGIVRALDEGEIEAECTDQLEQGDE